MDYFLSGGVLAYFHISMVLFKLMEKDLLETESMSEFLAHITNFIAEFDKIGLFKSELESFYINNRLFDHVRDHLINKETAQYHRKTKQRFNSEQCASSSPYCFKNKDSMFSSNSNLILRTECVLDNLKKGHFDISSDTKLHSENFAKKYTDDSFRDSLYRKKACPNHNFEVKQSFLCCKSTTLGVGSELLVHSGVGKSDGRSIDLNGLDSCMVSPNPWEEVLIIAVRSEHICHLQKDVLLFKEKTNKDKTAFFDNSSKLAYKNFTTRLKNYVIRAEHNLSAKLKVSTKFFVRNQELRNSLQQRRCSKDAPSRRRCQSQDRLELEDFALNDQRIRKTDLHKIKSIVSSINEYTGSHEEEYSYVSDFDDEDGEKIRTDYKISMIKAFMQLGRTRQSEHVE